MRPGATADVQLVLTNLLLLAAAATLGVGVRRSRRLAAIIGCGLAAAAMLVFVHGRLSAPVAEASVGRAEIADARRAYFERVVAGLPDRRVVAPRTRAESVSWFRTARLGLFIHYGPTSLLAAATDKQWWYAVDAGKFDMAARDFHPAPEVAGGWVALAQRIGASYLTVTAKHHDGFGLWDSRLTKWDVGPRHDLVRVVAREAQRRRIPLFIYYSLLDLHEPTYSTDKDAYLVFVEGQLRELLTEYGPIAGVWFDGWNRDFGKRRLSALYGLVHELQPWALVATNHHLQPFAGEDFRIYEGVFPRDRARPAIPREVAVKLGPTWFWSGKPPRLDRLGKLLARADAADANLLVDIPPRPDGTIPPSLRTRRLPRAR
jgi:alpha-L-fucosidase